MSQSLPSTSPRKKEGQHNSKEVISNEDANINLINSDFFLDPTNVIQECNFSRKESKEFYKNNYEKPNGMAFLISKAFYGHHKLPETLNDDEVQLCLRISILVKSMSVNQAQLLGSLLELLFKKIEECVDQARNGLVTKSTIVRIPPIPKNTMEIRNKI